MFFLHFAIYVLILTSISLVLLIGLGMLTEHYVHRVGRRYTKRIHRDLFANLLSTSMSMISESHAVRVWSILMESNFKGKSYIE